VLGSQPRERFYSVWFLLLGLRGRETTSELPASKQPNLVAQVVARDWLGVMPESAEAEGFGNRERANKAAGSSTQRERTIFKALHTLCERQFNVLKSQSVVVWRR
jgi:hypothetical protein